MEKKLRRIQTLITSLSKRNTQISKKRLMNLRHRRDFILGLRKDLNRLTFR